MSQVSQNGSRPTPVILGGFVNGLGIARALGEAGLVSIVVSQADEIAFHSRHVVARRLPDPLLAAAEFDAGLLQLAHELPHGGVVFATSDVYLSALMRARPALEAAGMQCPMSGRETLDLLLSKTRTMGLARELGVVTPLSVDIPARELASAAKTLRFPAILKPEVTIGFREALGLNRQTLFLQTMEDAKSAQARLAAAGLADAPMVVQEFIPGPASQLYTISTFSDREGRIHAYSCGHKIRQYPPEAGTICCGRVVPTPELLAPTARLFEAVSFYGVANTEYKFDPRDRLFKLMEVNPRPGKWNSSATRTGVNLPLLAYSYAVDDVLPPIVVTSQETAVWIEAPGYLLSLASEYGARGLARGLFKHPGEPGDKRIDAIFAWDDPMPALANADAWFSRFARKGAGRLFRR
jgi:D-aspartate ligase